MASELEEGRITFQKDVVDGAYIVRTDTWSGEFEFAGYVQKHGNCWRAERRGKVLGCAATRIKAAELLVSA